MGLLDASLEIITYDCVDCKRTLPEEQYYWKKAGDRHSHSCRACYQLKRRGYQIDYFATGPGKEKARNRHCPEKRSEYIVKSYGLTLDKYNQMVKVQGGGCAICGSKQAKTKRNGRFCVDHNHATGEVRGLLCAPCNRGIGLLGDNPDTLKLAAEYLLSPPSRRAWDC
jgi:hypothetical protein